MTEPELGLIGGLSGRRPAWPAAAVAIAAAVLLAGCWDEPSRPERSSRHPARGAPHAAAHRAPAASEYVVERGDTLYSIAFRNQLDYHDLASWNGIGRDYTIYPGRVLRLSPPSGSGDEPAATRPPASAAPPPVQAAAVQAAPAQPPRPAPGPSVAMAAPPPSGALITGPAFDAGRWEWPTRGSVAHRFGNDGSKGIDIAGDAGQIVIAAAGGKVVYSGSALKGYGELIIVKHDEQYLSAYGYNRRRLVEEGQQVFAGQPIAEMGLGPEQKPMLHFEIRDKGRPVDPLPLLPSR